MKITFDAAVVSLIISSVFVFPQSAEAATYTFAQTDWSGGATANTAVHPINHLSLNYL